MVISKPEGLPRRAALSDREYWVFAMQTGIASPPSALMSFRDFLAAFVKVTPSAP